MFRVLYFLAWAPIMLLFRARSHHRERIPKTGFLLCANHTSMLDPVILYRLFFRKIHFMAKKEAFKNPLVGWFLRRLGAFPVQRGGADMKAIHEAIKWVEKGEIVCIFPQGTRCPGVDPADTKVYGGVGLIAYHTKAPVLPVRIWNKGNKTRIFHRNDLIAGELIPNEALGLAEGNSAAYNAAAQKIKDAICALTPDW